LSVPYWEDLITGPGAQGDIEVPCGRKRKLRKIATHKRKKKLRKNRHKNK
jgi:hypothetical protein